VLQRQQRQQEWHRLPVNILRTVLPRTDSDPITGIPGTSLRHFRANRNDLSSFVPGITVWTRSVQQAEFTKTPPPEQSGRQM